MGERFLYETYEALEEAQDKKALYASVQHELALAKQSVKHPLRPYQENALQRFFHYETQYANKNKNNHLLFEMATGTGKTMLMAALLPYFYKRGYRTFLFFVNRTQIVEKTKQNFMDAHSSKYVFANALIINGERIPVQAIDSIADINHACINIVFTTIQSLHTRMKTQKENTVTLEDFAQQKIVLLADEAHHTSTETKKGLELAYSWEDTVQTLFTQREENYLLEFTATADLDKHTLKEKYRNKALIRYGLKQFRNDGYSKHIHLAHTKTESLEDRFLLACITSQYREEIASKYGLTIKPIILFKSKTIKESKAAHAQFHALIETLEDAHIAHMFDLVKHYKELALYKHIYEFFTSGDFSRTFLTSRVRTLFSQETTINVNNDTELESMQMALNTLEEPTNKYRVIFAVDKLNEGWDVLNLYDIVKLYETPSTKENPPTTQEIQLIGRGARLFPFALEAHHEYYQRKYDSAADDERAVLEQLHFHTADGSKFIQQLNKDLEEAGLIDGEMKEVEIRLKDTFIASDTYKKQYLYLNQRVPRERRNVLQQDLFGKYTNEDFKNISATYTFDVQLDVFDLYAERKNMKDYEYIRAMRLTLQDIPPAIFLKAVARNPFFRFAEIAKKFEIRSILEIKEGLHDNQLEILYPQGYAKKDIRTPRALLKVCESFLRNLQTRIEEVWTDYVGTQQLISKPIKEVFTNKKVLIGKQEYLQDYRAYPYFAQESVKVNSYEEDCIQEIHRALENANMRVMWLIRNERHFRIYNFEDGKAFEPDFLLMLEGNNHRIFQIFIEPKGEHLQRHDLWKEQLLKDMKDIPTDNGHYELVALPFYIPEKKAKFLSCLQSVFTRARSYTHKRQSPQSAKATLGKRRGSSSKAPKQL